MSSKCLKCAKERVSSESLPRKFAPWIFCACADGELDAHGLDRTVKTSAAAPELESQYLDGELKARYKLLAYIGSGGGGIIYKVADRTTGEEAVLKLIKHDLPEQAKQRFEIEAKACSLISHANVVRILEYGVTQSGVHFIVMPYCKGASLRSLFQNKMADEVLIIDIFRQICQGLDAAHKNGIVHRDMKPENVLVDTTDSGSLVHIIDFGIAKLSPAGGEIQALTQTGEIFGTPAYMSPEQCTGRRTDARTDIYSVGCMLFEAFVGQPPFRAENAFLTLSQHMDGDVPSIPRLAELEHIAERLEAIVHKCMEKIPDNRYQSTLDLARDLSSLHAGKSIFARAKSVVSIRRIGAVVLVLIAVLFSAAAWQALQWKKQASINERQSDTTRILATLEKAVIAIEKGDSKTALRITNHVIQRLEADGLLEPKSSSNKEQDEQNGISYNAAYREALFLRGHAQLLEPGLVTKAQADFQRCANMYGNDPVYESSLAFSHLRQNEVRPALLSLQKVRPTLAALRARFNRQTGFSDGWNNPDIIQRIKAAKQEIVFQDIVRVDSCQADWTDVGIDVKPEYRLWIDCKDDCMWTVGVRETDNLPTWSDADGRVYRKLHEENIMCLLGMIGNNHSFFVGRHLWNAIAPGTGRLRLICNDGAVSLGGMPPEGLDKKVCQDNRGSMTVRVIVTKPLNHDNVTGWTTPDLYKSIEAANQRIVAQTVIRVDARNNHWTIPNGITVNPGNRLWFDCKDGELTDFMCPADGISVHNTIVNASGRKGAVVHGFNVGALIGRIGDHYFPVGTSALNMVPPTSGNVMLIFNDGAAEEEIIPLTGGDPLLYSDNKGAYTVRIIVTEPDKRDG